MKILDRPGREWETEFAEIIVGFVAFFLGTQTDNLFFTIFLGGAGAILIIPAVINILKGEG